MSDKISNLGTSDNNETQDANSDDNRPHIEDPAIIIRENDHKNDIKSDNSKKTENNETRDAKEAKKLPKKQFSDSKTDVATYLRSEFTGLTAQDVEGKQDATDKLPNYKDIDTIGFSRKYTDKKSKLSNFREKARKIYSTDTVTVQFFASEDIPEDRVLMVYDPESRNFTIKGMFMILMIIHLLIVCGSMLIFLTPASHGSRHSGYIFCIPPFILFFITIMLVICLQRCRSPKCGCLMLFMGFATVGTATSSLGGYFSTRMFIFSYTVMAATDLTCGVLGCFQYDYSSKLLYGVALGSGAVYLLIFVPAINFGFQGLYYWGFFDQDVPLTFALCVVFTLVSIAAMVAELHFLLGGEWVELAEDDYVFGAFLLFIALFDFPIRMLRKYCTAKRDEEDEDD